MDVQENSTRPETASNLEQNNSEVLSQPQSEFEDGHQYQNHPQNQQEMYNTQSSQMTEENVAQDIEVQPILQSPSEQTVTNI